MKPAQVFYEPSSLDYELGKRLKEKFADVTWTPIENHNNIEELRTKENAEFANLKRLLIVGTRKTHKYVENHKVSDYLVPFTSSGCTAMCLYCYLVCNYNKCSYLRLFVNREEMLERLIRTSNKLHTGGGTKKNLTDMTDSLPFHSQTEVPLLKYTANFKNNQDYTFEIGSNSDLILENTITDNLPWTIESFLRCAKGNLTFPTKFDMVEPLLPLNHKGRIIFRMSVNPQQIIRDVELGTASLKNRIDAINRMAEAEYRVGILIAPVILVENWKVLYLELFDILETSLSKKMKKQMFIEIIFMTYSYVHQKINSEAFPNATVLYDKELMTGRGMGKYCYKQPLRSEGELFIRDELERRFGTGKILYIS
ncbi:MAG TPA: spore photoproduct lyase [Lachnospiraceae bacterium]|nr:spore photoproduct lyase [Lachnospiraceae bacterium]